MRHYSRDVTDKLKYLIRASLYAQYCAKEKGFNDVEDFLQRYESNQNSSIFRNLEFKAKVIKDCSKFVSVTTLLRYVSNLIKFYKKKVEEDANLNLDSILHIYQGLSRTEIENYVKVKSYNTNKQQHLPQFSPVGLLPPSDPSTTSLVPYGYNNICGINNNGFAVSPLQARGMRSLGSEDTNESFLSPGITNNIDELDFDYSTNSKVDLDISGELLESGLKELPPLPGTEEDVSDSPLSLEAPTTKPSKNNNSEKATKGRKQNQTKKRKSDSKTGNNNKKKSTKTKPIDPSVKRITTIPVKEKDALVLQKKVAELCNSYSKQEIMDAVEVQEKINILCKKLKKAIDSNFSQKQKASNRDGFNVEYSNNMGYHSQNGKLRGFTINENNKYYHNFNEKKRTEKTKWEQQIWEIGIEIMKLKGFNEDKGDEYFCMEFGFMKEGNYVNKV